VLFLFFKKLPANSSHVQGFANNMDCLILLKFQLKVNASKVFLRDAHYLLAKYRIIDYSIIKSFT